MGPFAGGISEIVHGDYKSFHLGDDRVQGIAGLCGGSPQLLLPWMLPDVDCVVWFMGLTLSWRTKQISWTHLWRLALPLPQPSSGGCAGASERWIQKELELSEDDPAVLCLCRGVGRLVVLFNMWHSSANAKIHMLQLATVLLHGGLRPLLDGTRVGTDGGLRRFQFLFLRRSAHGPIATSETELGALEDVSGCPPM